MPFKTLEDKVNTTAIVGCITYITWHIYYAVAAGRWGLSFLAW